LECLATSVPLDQHRKMLTADEIARPRACPVDNIEQGIKVIDVLHLCTGNRNNLVIRLQTGIGSWRIVDDVSDFDMVDCFTAVIKKFSSQPATPSLEQV